MLSPRVFFLSVCALVLASAVLGSSATAVTATYGDEPAGVAVWEVTRCG